VQDIDPFPSHPTPETRIAERVPHVDPADVETDRTRVPGRCGNGLVFLPKRCMKQAYDPVPPVPQSSGQQQPLHGPAAGHGTMGEKLDDGKAFHQSSTTQIFFSCWVQRQLNPTPACGGLRRKNTRLTHPTGFDSSLTGCGHGLLWTGIECRTVMQQAPTARRGRARWFERTGIHRFRE
jgi:hypothetical protein